MCSQATENHAAFLLTSEWEDSPSGHVLRYFAVGASQKRYQVLVDHAKPLFFTARHQKLPRLSGLVQTRDVELRNFDHQPVQALYFDGQKSLRKARGQLKDLGITTYESDIRPDRRYLMERFINAPVEISGSVDSSGQFLSLRNPQLTPGDFIPSFRVLSLDIETGVRSGQLYSIGLHLTTEDQEISQVLMLADSFCQVDDQLTFYASESALLKAFFEWLRRYDPDIIIGWNIFGFDLEFIEKKCQQFRIPFLLGRSDRLPSIRKRERMGYVADVSGRVVIDGPQALRAAFYSFEDYRLETVGRELTGEGKKISSDDDKIAEIERQFREDKKALAAYNLQDCVLVSRIFQKTAILEQYTRRAQISGLFFNQMGLSVAAFDHFYLPRLHRKGLVAGDKDDVKPEGHAAGGYVMRPAPGIYDHVVVLDFRSLYPSIIQTYKIEPLSRLMADRSPIITPDGRRFSATENLLPDFIAGLLESREQAKANDDQALSQAIKILMNSFYGVMGSYGCRFYHKDLPSAITGTGQWLLKGCRTFLEAQGYQVLYGDTDSVFVQLRPQDIEEPETVGKNLARQLNQHWQKLLHKEGLTSYLQMEYEKYYRKFVLPLARNRHLDGGGASKRYAGLLKKNGELQLDIVGMEYVRSDWTPLAKNFQFELYDRVLREKEIDQWIRELLKKLKAGELDQDLIYSKRLRKDAKDYVKNISPQVRAARMLKKPSRSVKYWMTLRGPIPVEQQPKDIDYRHYIDKQLRPIADSLLGLTGISFDDFLAGKQLCLPFDRASSLDHKGLD